MSQFIKSYTSHISQEDRLKFSIQSNNFKYIINIIPTISLSIKLNLDKRFESVTFDFKFLSFLVRFKLEKTKNN
jgi:hypothetical protein